MSAEENTRLVQTAYEAFGRGDMAALAEVMADDIAGLAVHIAARVSARAGASEVLVSSTVKDLVVGSELDFDDRGSHDLKGVPGSWHLFAVRR